MSISLLQRLIGAGFALLFLGFLFVLISSLGERKSADPEAAFQDLSIGQTGKRRLRGQVVWATRLSEHQRSNLSKDDPCLTMTFCIVAAAGSVDGIDVVYTINSPPQLNKLGQDGVDKEGQLNVWTGGFVDPSNGHVYGLSGNPILPKDSQALSLLTP